MDVRLPGPLQKIMASEAEASRLAQARAAEVMKIWLGKTVKALQLTKIMASDA